MSAVPAALRLERRWVNFCFLGGRKPPCDVEGKPLAEWNQEANWLTYDEALARFRDNEAVSGIGFVTGGGYSMFDLDDCRAEDGTLDPRAQAVLDLVPTAYAEVSPSGKGLKVFGRGEGWVECNFRGAAVRAERKATGYGCITGDALPGRTAVVELPLDAVLATFAQQQHQGAERKAPTEPAAKVVAPGSQESEMFKHASRLRRLGHNVAEITATLWAMVREGKFPNEPGREAWTQEDCQRKAESAARFPAGDKDFTRGTENKILSTVENVRKALHAIGATPRRDRFSEKVVIAWDGERGTRDLDDEELRRVWFTMHEALGFAPADALLAKVVEHEADTNDFHPVLDYINGLKWDGTPRVGVWLSYYLSAEHTEYTKAVGQLVLVGAVRRVRRPGTKFDELLVLESPQGKDKSNALRTLCPNPAWFSESLPLGVDAKVTIERTLGVWIVEAAEMVTEARDAERLKAFLSTQVDGPARLAYARRAVTRPRHFVVVGTTNKGEYLTDSTGNRRFWPVRVGNVDIKALRSDRDQLWAEAAHLESLGVPTRLDSQLWAVAEGEQEARRVMDPWEEVLAEAFGDGPGKVLNAELWSALRVDAERRTQKENARLGGVMRRLGCTPSTIKHKGRVLHGWVRGGQHNQERPWLLNPQQPGEQPF